MEEIYVLEIINDGFLYYTKCEDLKETIKAVYNNEQPDDEDIDFQRKLAYRVDQAYSNEDYIDVLDFANSYSEQWIYADLYVVVDITGDIELTRFIKKSVPLKFVATSKKGGIKWCDIKSYDYNLYLQTNEFDDTSCQLKANRIYYIHNCYDKDTAINIAKMLVKGC